MKDIFGKFCILDVLSMKFCPQQAHLLKTFHNTSHNHYIWKPKNNDDLKETLWKYACKSNSVLIFYYNTTTKLFSKKVSKKEENGMNCVFGWQFVWLSAANDDEGWPVTKIVAPIQSFWWGGQSYYDITNAMISLPLSLWLLASFSSSLWKDQL